MLDTRAEEARSILADGGGANVRVEWTGNGYLVAARFPSFRASGHTGIDQNTSDDPRDMARHFAELAQGVPNELPPADTSAAPSPPEPPAAASGMDADGDGGGDPAPEVVVEGIEAAYTVDSPGIMVTPPDVRRAELADALTNEYRARVTPVRDKRGEANTRIVTLTNQPERNDEQVDELNVLHDRVRGYDTLIASLTDHLLAMQDALLHKPAGDLAAFDPAYGWP